MKIERNSKIENNKRNSSNSPFFVIQPKLLVGASNDKFEKEADAQAEKVVNQNVDSANSFFKTSKVQTKSNTQNPSSTSTSFQSEINSTKNNGSKLPESTTKKMNNAFQNDFGNVNIHTGNKAEKLNDEIGAQAFTYQNNIFFNKNKYNPNTKEGEKLLAHELTHVVQQQAITPIIQRDPPVVGEEDKKIAEKKTTIIQNFKLKAIDGEKSWSLNDLTKLEAGLNTLPESDKIAIEKLKFIRVTSIPGSIAGFFGTQQAVDLEGTITNEASITLDDDTFSGDVLTSKLVIVHEVGHAIANLKRRKAVHERNKAISKTNIIKDQHNQLNSGAKPILESFNDSVEVMNNLVERFNEAIKNKNKELVDELKPQEAKARKDYETKKIAWEKEEKKINSAKSKVTAAEKVQETKTNAAKKTMVSATDLSTIKGKVNPAKKDFNAKNKIATTKFNALEKDKKDSGQNYHIAIQNVSIEIENLSAATHESQLDESKVDPLIEKVNAAIIIRKTERDNLNSSDKPHPALAIFSNVEAAQDAWLHAAKAHSLAHDRYRIVQKFAAFVEKNNISPITKYAADNWPQKPEEFYAESYSWFIVQPEKLKTTSAVLHKWFKDGNFK